MNFHVGLAEIHAGAEQRFTAFFGDSIDHQVEHVERSAPALSNAVARAIERVRRGGQRRVDGSEGNHRVAQSFELFQQCNALRTQAKALPPGDPQKFDVGRSRNCPRGLRQRIEQSVCTLLTQKNGDERGGVDNHRGLLIIEASQSPKIAVGVKILGIKLGHARIFPLRH